MKESERVKMATVSHARGFDETEFNAVFRELSSRFSAS